MSAELDAFRMLELAGQIKPSEVYSPALAKEGTYSQRLKTFRQKVSIDVGEKGDLIASVDGTAGGVLGGVGKPPSAAEVLQARLPEEWLVDEIACRGSLMLLAGDSGAGKSTLIYGMAQAMSTGTLFMGQLKARTSKVLVVQADENVNNAQRKLQVMGMVPEFDLITDMAVLDMPRLTMLQTAYQYDAILLDSITTLLGGNPNGPGMCEAEFGQPLYELNRWAADHNALVGMTCHLRKRSRDSTTNAVRLADLFGAGSQGWAASDVWAIWRAEKPDPTYDTHFVMRCLKGRFCEEGTTWHVEGFKEDFTHRLAAVADPNDVLPMRRREISQRIIELIRSSSKEWRTSEVATAVGCNVEHARRVLLRLMTEGVLKRRRLPTDGGRPLYVYGA